jgi:hypothetical protein
MDLQFAMMQQNYKFPKRKFGAGKEERYFFTSELYFLPYQSKNASSLPVMLIIGHKKCS